MITGFNTDVAHEGVVYHVQTEDKGVNSPVILSLVYVGGAILASKRAPYDDLLESGFSETALAERLRHQHKLICAAIRAGRIDELKRLGGRETSEQAAAAPTTAARDETHAAQFDDGEILEIFHEPQVIKLLSEEAELDLTTAEPLALTIDPDATSARRDAEVIQNHVDQARPPVASAASSATSSASYTVRPIVRNGVADFARGDAPPGVLHLALLNEEAELRAGKLVALRIYVGSEERGRKPVPDAPVTVKILGTEFRQRILSAKTDGQGVALIEAALPNFARGRAAIVIQVTVGEYEAELRRIIQPA